MSPGMPCNRFYCGGLWEFQNGLTQEGPIRVFLAAAQGDTVTDAVFCDENGSRTVPVPPPDEHGASAEGETGTSEKTI
jgi:hypothetical protein